MIVEAYVDGTQIHGGPSDIAISTFARSVPPRIVRDLRPDQHGEVVSTRHYGAAVYSLTGFVRGATVAAAHETFDELRRLLVLNGEDHTFTFRREGFDFDEQFAFRLNGNIDAPWSSSSRLIRWGCELVSADPRLYSATEVSASYDPEEEGFGGLFFPLEFPLDFGVDDTSSRLTVDHEGTVPTPPVFVVTGPVTNPIIDNETTGLSIHTTETELASGDTLTFDVASRNVILGGTTSRPDLIDVVPTDWFFIVPGVNQLRLRGDDMALGETELAVTFRNARI